jgi:phosphatidylserine decarboxylase
MRIDPAGWPFVVTTLAVAGLIGLWLGPWWAVPFLVLLAVFLYFFRDPERQASVAANDVLSPADGRVVVAGDVQPGAAPPGNWRQLSIFLSPLDVHVNRVPVSGRVLKVDYKPGRFLPAYRDEAATENERNELWIDHDGQTVVCRQVVGILARRIVCRVGAGATVESGARFGVMKFGSRIDLFLPPSARIEVGVGDHVQAGVTIVARLAALGG